MTKKRELKDRLVLSEREFEIIQDILCLMYPDDLTTYNRIHEATVIEIEKGS